MPELPETQEDWLKCIELPEYLQMIPSGCIRPIAVPIQWIDGNGSHLSNKEYVDKYGINPSIAWDAVKEYRRRAGKKENVRVL